MANERKLTAKQEAFCKNIALENMIQRDAYIAAYGKGNKTDKSVDELASRLMKNVKIVSRINELKDAITEKVIWSKAEMINQLKEIADECIDSLITQLVGENGVRLIPDTKARSVAVNAIKTASDMLGYKAPDKIEHSGNVTFEQFVKTLGEEY